MLEDNSYLVTSTRRSRKALKPKPFSWAEMQRRLRAAEGDRSGRSRSASPAPSVSSMCSSVMSDSTFAGYHYTPSHSPAMSLSKTESDIPPLQLDGGILIDGKPPLTPLRTLLQANEMEAGSDGTRSRRSVAFKDGEVPDLKRALARKSILDVISPSSSSSLQLRRKSTFYRAERQDTNPILHKPVIKHPEHEITKEAWHDFIKNNCQQNLKGHSTDAKAAWSKASRIIKTSMRIESRWFVRKLEDLDTVLDPQTQAEMMIEHGVPLCLDALDDALAQANLEAKDIGAVFFATHNPYPFPALSSYVMSERDFPYDCAHFPMMTFGCAGGGMLLANASDWVRAHPEKNAVILCCELSSLGFRPYKKGMSWFINSSLFGDGAAACVIQGANFHTDVPGELGEAGEESLTARVIGQKQHTVPRSERAMYYEYDFSGYNFRVDPTIIKQVVSGVKGFIEGFVEEMFETDSKASDLQHVCIHPGGAKIVSGIYGGLGLNKTKSEAHCYAALSEGGNRSSVTVLDILARSWEHAASDEEGLVIGMGVGFIMGGIALRFE